MEIRYPAISVKLVGTDGNAFAIMGKVRNALRQNNVGNDEIKKFTDECMEGDYNHLLATCMKWVDVE